MGRLETPGPEECDPSPQSLPGQCRVQRHGSLWRLSWTIDDYVALASAFPFRWWASLDYCVEQEVARDREEVLDRIARTVRANIECHARAVDRNIASTFLPVIQGRLPQDYERCATALAGLVERHTLIGVGSMCRRPIHGDAGLIAVVDHLDRVLPPAVRLHLFGVKGAAIPFLKPFARRVASIDSQACGIAARSKARAHGCRKSDDLVADEMERWVEQQRAATPACPRPADRGASDSAAAAVRSLGRGDRPSAGGSARAHRKRRPRS
jgi:hypothetical protein